MWSDRSDEDEMPPERPGWHLLLVFGLYAALLFTLSIGLALVTR